MEVQQLRHFLAAMRYGNIGQAAEHLNITQSGLSRSIKNLEDTLGLPLLKRNPRGVEPTAFGLSLAPRAQAILNERDRALDDLTAMRKARSGSIRLGVTLNFAHYFVSDVVAAFLRERPGIDVTVVSGAYPDLVEKVQIAELDMAFGLVGPFPETSLVVIEQLFQSHSAVCCRADHPLAEEDFVSAAQLAQSDWALPDSPGFRRAFDEFFAAKGLPAPRQTVKTNSIAFLRRCVLDLGLLTILPEQLIDADVKRGDLIVLATETPGGLAPAGIVRRADDMLTPAMRDLIRVFREQVPARYLAA